MATDNDSILGFRRKLTKFEPPHVYQYERLDENKSQIRLLRLQLDAFADRGFRTSPPIHCDIETFDINAAPAYIALSYVWGPAFPQIRLFVNRQAFGVGLNLFEFLKSFRNDPANVQHLWIDQLCIDQNNPLEKNHQVNLMSRIYKSCLFTLVWLGLPAHVNHAFTWDSDGKLNINCLQEILRNPYFDRFWIVQEVLLAPLVWVLYGFHWISWKKLSRSAIPYLRNDWTSTARLFRQKNEDVPASVVYHALKEHRRLDLTLNAFSSMKCRDPRDKVYGLLGIVEGSCVLAVDYRKNSLEVFVDVISLLRAKIWNWHYTQLWRLNGNVAAPEEKYHEYQHILNLAQNMELLAVRDLHDFFWELHRLGCKLYNRYRKDFSAQAPPLTIRAEPLRPNKTGRLFYKYKSNLYFSAVLRDSASTDCPVPPLRVDRNNHPVWGSIWDQDSRWSQMRAL